MSDAPTNTNTPDPADPKTLPESVYDPIPNAIPATSAWATRFNAYFKLIALILSVAASPLIAHCVTEKVEEMRLAFEKDDRARKREHEQRIQNQKMRNALVQQILEVCKTADLDNIAHAYRLGWIAEIVETNPKVFDLNMKKAKEKLDKIIDKIDILDNVRQRLIESKKSETNLKAKVSKYDEKNAALEKKLQKARQVLQKTQWRTYTDKKKWKDKIEDMEKDLSRAKFRRRMYSRWLQREQLRRRMYAFQLRHTKSELSRKMREAETQKKQDAKKIKRLHVALGKLRQTSTKELDEVKRLAKKLTDANTKAQLTITDLKDEIKRLKETNASLTADNKKLTEQAQACAAKTTKPSKGMGVK